MTTRTLADDRHGRRLEDCPASVRRAFASMGGKARARALTARELSAIGKRGAAVRMRKLSKAERSAIARLGGLARQRQHRRGAD